MNRRTTGLLTALVVLAGAASWAALALATTPGGNGQIAFQRYRFSDNPLWAEIFVAGTDGTGARKLTHPLRGWVDGEPDWSPDGSRIVFSRCPGSAQGICSVWVVRSDGSGATRLSCSRFAEPLDCGHDNGPSFAPDGRHVLLTRSWGDVRRDASGEEVIEHSELVEVDLKGRKRRVVARRTGHRGDVIGAALSPNGRRLAYIVVNSSFGRPKLRSAVFVANADGTGARRVTQWSMRVDDRLDWSPDGTQILFRGGPGTMVGRGQGNLYTIRPDGTRLRQLTHFAQRSAVLRTGSFSPDGRSIVFGTTIGATSVNGTDLPDVFIMASDGTSIRPLTRTRNWEATGDWGRRR